MKNHLKVYGIPAVTADSSNDGLMSSDDKINLDYLLMHPPGSCIKHVWNGLAYPNRVSFNIDDNWFYNKNGYKTLSLGVNVFKNIHNTLPSFQETKTLFFNVYMTRTDLYGFNMVYTSPTRSGVIIYDYLYEHSGSGVCVSGVIAMICFVELMQGKFRCTLSNVGSYATDCVVTDVFVILPKE